MNMPKEENTDWTIAENKISQFQTPSFYGCKTLADVATALTVQFSLRREGFYVFKFQNIVTLFFGGRSILTVVGGAQ